MNFKQLVELDKYLSIAAHTPGRIRIKFSAAVATHPAVREIMKEDLKPPRGVKSTRFNLLARSVIIEYDPRIIAPSLLETLVKGKKHEEKVKLLQQFHAEACE